jgi:hypothetical protein
MAQGVRSGKTAALFLAAVVFTGIPNSNSVQAQSRAAVNTGHAAGFMHGGPGGNFSHERDGFWGRDFRHGFDRNRRDFGTNIVVAPTVVAPAAPYYVPGPPYEYLRCFLHREVQTPNGPALEPVYVC